VARTDFTKKPPVQLARLAGRSPERRRQTRVLGRTDFTQHPSLQLARLAGRSPERRRQARVLAGQILLRIPPFQLARLAGRSPERRRQTRELAQTWHRVVLSMCYFGVFAVGYLNTPLPENSF
jgi:hypothetical protein